MKCPVAQSHVSGAAMRRLGVAIAVAATSIQQPPVVETPTPVVQSPEDQPPVVPAKVGINYGAMTKSLDKYIDNIFEMTNIKTAAQMRRAFDTKNTCITWVRDEDGTTNSQLLYLSGEQYGLVEKLVGKVSDETMAELFGVKKEQLLNIYAQYSCMNVADVMESLERCRTVFGAALLMRHIPGFSAWVHRKAEENHPFFKDVDAGMELPRGIELAKFQGVQGLVPFNAHNKQMIPTVMDNWFYRKNAGLHPVDKRTMLTEIDMREHKSRLAIFFAIVQKWSLQVARPAERDKAYYHLSAEEKPYDGIALDLTHSKRKLDWDIPQEVATILNDVMPSEILRPAMSREVAMRFAAFAPQMQPTLFTKGDEGEQLLNKIVKARS